MAVVRHGDHTHRLAPAREDPDRGYATRRTRTVCRIPLNEATMPPLPAGTTVTCPRCTRHTKEN
ncbi:hypothetical protein Q7689_00190 [Nocardiopsis tropica]|uniref:hypothetical protein n=1 Tax=Nocardiopsis tropica TaxID=109330 RepID=UPI002E87378E|nr:hypothetical protein [Nocardiopsis tropica]